MSEENENKKPEEEEATVDDAAASAEAAPAAEEEVAAPPQEEAPVEAADAGDAENADDDVIASGDTIAAAVGGEEKSEKLLRAEAILQEQAGTSGGGGGSGGGGNRGGHGGGGRGRDSDRFDDGPELFEKVVFINRCAKVVKGGRRFSFSALMVVGDQNGKVGFGFGKANEVAEGIRKASDSAKKNMDKVKITANTIPHEVIGEFGGGRVLLRPASPGTGIIAGGGVRAVVEAAGIKDILAKSLGSNNHANVVKATLAALHSLRTKEEIYKLRGKKAPEKAAL